MIRRTVVAVGLAALALAGVVSAATVPGLAEADVNAALQRAHEKYRTLQEGKNADYIPALARGRAAPGPATGGPRGRPRPRRDRAALPNVASERLGDLDVGEMRHVQAQPGVGDPRRDRAPRGRPEQQLHQGRAWSCP
jgi:hypothetical protein